MISFTTLCIDAQYNGGLTGKHFEQSEWDLVGHTADRAIKFSLRADELPEVTVVSYLNKIYADPCSNDYRLKQPLKPFPPEPGVPLKERIRRQAAACFLQLTGGYLPIAFSPSDAEVSIRKRIRALQLADGNPEYLTCFCAKLGIPEPVTQKPIQTT